MEMTNILGYIGVLISILITGAIFYIIAAALFKFGPFLPFCSKHIDICKHNGTCINMPDSDYRCDSCDRGWTGKECDEPDETVIGMRPCSIDPDRCFHNGICLNVDKDGDGIMDDFRCNHCDKGWSGKTCNDPDENIEIDEECNADDGERQPGLQYCPSLRECVSNWDLNCPDACPGTFDTIWCPELQRCINRLTSDIPCPSLIEVIEEVDCQRSERWSNSIDDCECDPTFDCNQWSASGISGGSGDGNKTKCDRMRCCDWNDSQKSCNYYNWYDEDRRRPSTSSRSSTSHNLRTGHKGSGRTGLGTGHRGTRGSRHRGDKRRRGNGFVVGGLAEY